MIEPIEGKSKYLALHTDEFQGKKLPLMAVSDDEESEQNLADFLGDFIGSVEGKGISDSRNIGEQFAAYLVEKHKEGHL